MRKTTVISLAGAAFGLMLSSCALPPTLTPDVAVLKIAPTQCGAANNPKRIKEFVDSEMGKEIHRIRDAELIVLGTVSRVAPELHEQGVRTVVTVSVERCIKGPCADTTSFYVPGADLGDRSLDPHPALTFRPGDRAVLLLGGLNDRSTGEDLPEVRPPLRYTVDHEGQVVRKRIPVEQFIAELTEIL